MDIIEFFRYPKYRVVGKIITNGLGEESRQFFVHFKPSLLSRWKALYLLGEGSWIYNPIGDSVGKILHSHSEALSLARKHEKHRLQNTKRVALYSIYNLDKFDFE
jgi:hypothetical protein